MGYLTPKMPISDKKIENEIFSNLVDTAKNSSDESTTSSPLASDASEKIQDVLRESLGKAANAAEVLAQKVKINFRAVKNKDHKVSDNPTVASAVNWLADAFKDVIDKINDQGEILSFVLTQLGKMMETDTFKEEQKKKHDDLEKKCDELVKKCDDLEKKCDAITVASDEELKQKHVDLEKKVKDVEDSLTKKCDDEDIKQKYADLEKKAKDAEDTHTKKCEDLDKKYDEVRQRCLKGNLIVSSPARTTTSGHTIPTQAKHQMFNDRYGRYRCETDLEMVLRLVHMKTGFRIQECEVTACHPLGRREKNTFILSVHNRTPMSSWEAITKGMMIAENNFSKDNIFINFQLTKMRGEICKEVRRAKKENLIKSYEIDVNGRIYVRENENKSLQITDMKQILKYFPGENVN